MNSKELMGMGSESHGVLAGLRSIAKRIVPNALDVINAKSLSGGASQEIWSFEIVASEGAAPFILRRAHVWSEQFQSSSAGMAVEAGILRAAIRQNIPVPGVRYVLQPEDGLGEGFVMDRVAGETIPRKILRDDLFADVRPQLARECGAILARIHRLVCDELPKLSVSLAQQQLANFLTQYRMSGAIRPVFALAFQWLQEHMPSEDIGLTLVHGDFRNGNLMIGPDGVRAVLDWELAHFGDPMEDLGFFCVNSWRFGNIDLPAGGFGSREEFFAGYRAGGGTVFPERVKYWEVLGTLKWGVACDANATAFATGVDKSVERAAIARRASETEMDLMQLLSPRI